MSFYRTIARIRLCRQTSVRRYDQTPVRYASLNSAIERGLRQTDRSLKTPNRATKLPICDRRDTFNDARRGRRWEEDDETEETTTSQPPGRRRERRRREYTDEEPERVKPHVKTPNSIPHFHPASEFIYGANAVEAALRCSRRKLYRLYIYQAAGEQLNDHKIAMRKIALSKHVSVKMAFGDWYRLFDKASGSRPHNGYILEASRLPVLPAKSFYPLFDPLGDCFGVELGPQSREEMAVNGSNNEIPIVRGSRGNQKRYPVVLLLEGILDPGNLGAIIRSAYYLGVDAVVFAGRNSAPLSPVAIKASAGAAENMTFIRVTNETDFIERSQGNGWRFYAADPPGLRTTSDVHSDIQAVNQSPAVIMLGSEGTGLNNHIKRLADSFVSIPGVRNSIIGVSSDPLQVDSLNVSVAAALLMEKFLHVPVELSPA